MDVLSQTNPLILWGIVAVLAISSGMAVGGAMHVVSLLKQAQALAAGLEARLANTAAELSQTLAALREVEVQRDAVQGQVAGMEARVGAMEAQRDAQAKEMHKLRHDIAERPKLKTQLYRIVVVGMRSTGKTSLILKWANPTWEVRNPPGATLFNKFMRTVSSVINARSNVVVNHVFEIFDFGGERLVEAQETLVVDDVHGLLFVTDLGGEGASAVDEARIQQQTEAFSTQALQFFFKAPRIVKSCQTVVLFINKSDLLSGTPTEVERAARAHYAKLISALQSFDEQVQIEIMVGSSFSGHNTHRLMPHFIQKLLPEDAYDEQLQQRAQGQD